MNNKKVIECPCGCTTRFTLEEWENKGKRLQCCIGNCKKEINPFSDNYYNTITDTNQTWIFCEACARKMDDLMFKENKNWKRMTDE